MYGTTPIDVLIKGKMLVERVNSSDLDWVFNQKGIGITLNKLGEFGSSLLESKRTFDDVCADVSLCNLLMTGGYGGWVMTALGLSPVAIGKLVAGIVGLGTVTDINAVTASSSTMAIVASSSQAMSAIADSSIAMDSVLASSVAKTATLNTVGITEYKKKYTAMSKILANSAFVDSIRTTPVAKTAMLDNKVALTTVGSGTWTVPAGVTCITVAAVGGGGNGASKNSGGYVGGVCGLLKQKAFNVTAGQVISYTVSALGGNSIFSDLSSSAGDALQAGKLITKSLDGSRIVGTSNGYGGKGGWGGGNGGSANGNIAGGIGSNEISSAGTGGAGGAGSADGVAGTAGTAGGGGGGGGNNGDLFGGSGGGGYGGGGGAGGYYGTGGQGGQGAIAIFM